MARDSIVNTAVVVSMNLSATVQVGDVFKIDCKNNTFAVQRQVSNYLGNEGDLSLFPIFSRAIPKPIIHEYIQMNVSYPNPVIAVDHVRVIGVSVSSIIQIGSNRIMELESRVKHVRQLVSVSR